MQIVLFYLQAWPAPAFPLLHTDTNSVTGEGYTTPFPVNAFASADSMLSTAAEALLLADGDTSFDHSSASGVSHASASPAHRTSLAPSAQFAKFALQHLRGQHLRFAGALFYVHKEWCSVYFLSLKVADACAMMRTGAVPSNPLTCERCLFARRSRVDDACSVAY